MYLVIKNIFCSIIIILFISFTLKIYLSDQNVSGYKKISFKDTNKYYADLPILSNDTINIIEYRNDIEKIKNKKKRKWWDLID